MEDYPRTDLETLISRDVILLLLSLIQGDLKKLLETLIIQRDLMIFQPSQNLMEA